MANVQDSTLGERTYGFGPGVLYWDTSDGFIPAGFSGATGTGLFLGNTGPISWTESTAEIELFSIQTGSTPDDVGITGHTTQLATALREARTDVLNAVHRGISVEYESPSLITPVQIFGANRIGQRGRSIAKKLTYVEIIDGIEAWDDPFRVFDFFVAVPRLSESVLVSDAETQREVPINFHCFESKTLVDAENRPIRWASRAQQ
jgi:hypothetical protein